MIIFVKGAVNDRIHPDYITTDKIRKNHCVSDPKIQNEFSQNSKEYSKSKKSTNKSDNSEFKGKSTTTMPQQIGQVSTYFLLII